MSAPVSLKDKDLVIPMLNWADWWEINKVPEAGTYFKLIFFSLSVEFRVMVTVTAVLKTVSLLVAEFISNITDWFQTKPAWANVEVLEATELKTTGGGESETSRIYSDMLNSKVFLVLPCKCNPTFGVWDYVLCMTASIHKLLAVQSNDEEEERATFRFNNALLCLSVHERHKAKTLWEKTGAVIMVVRRPGWLLCREVRKDMPVYVTLQSLD